MLDAEAAFKKLTAAFEKLYDPAQQAASRAEANRRSAPGRSRGSSRSGASPNESYGGGGGDGGGGGGGGGGGCGAGKAGSTGEAPRWCREGEYVPKQEREKEEETPDAGKRKVGGGGVSVTLVARTHEVAAATAGSRQDLELTLLV